MTVRDHHNLYVRLYNTYEAPACQGVKESRRERSSR